MNNASSQWDWNEGKREILDTSQCPRKYDWIEEFYPSPDGERIAAVVKLDEEEEDSPYTLCDTGKDWEGAYDRVWYPRFSPDGRLTALVNSDMEWTLAVEGELWETGFDYVWDTKFSRDGSKMAVAMQREMRYGMALEGEPWPQLFTNATFFALSPAGNATAGVVQTRDFGQADIATYQEGCFSVAVNGKPWDRNFVNCWTPVFDEAGKRVAAQARDTLYDYTIVVDGEPWPARYASVWDPCFNPATGQVVAPVRLAGKWGLAADGEILWKPQFFQCWHQQISPDGEHVYALVAPRFGRWTVAKDGKPWSPIFRDMIGDLTVSPDGRRAAAVGREDGKWGVVVDDAHWVGRFPMVWKPVFSPDSKHLAVKIERSDGRYTIMMDGKQMERDFDMLWDPVFSPDGKLVMLRAMENGLYTRLVMPVDAI